MDSFSPVTELKGVGDKTAKLLNKIGVYSAMDILLFFPRTYLEYPKACGIKDAKINETVALLAQVKTYASTRHTAKMDITTATAFSEGLGIDLIWFRSPYIRSTINPGNYYIFYGKLEQKGNKVHMEQPIVYEPHKYESLRKSLQPIYPLTKGLTNTVVKKAISSALESVELNNKRLPSFVENERKFMRYSDALKAYHFPQSFDELMQARTRLAYEEIFYFILNTRLQDSNIKLIPNNFDIKKADITDDIISKLPFKLTGAQYRALEDVRNDISGDNISQRLIQGDVGSGKTMVAFLAMLDTVVSGYQSALMAPTEVLAMQHYETFIGLIEKYDLPYKVAVLTGSMKASMRKEMQKLIDEEKSLFIIGTHALISDKTRFTNLALVITDEQHRFGVKQRTILSEKGNNPHMVVMSATPIPRTLAMILYGNMAVSVIDELPATRLPIKTCVIQENLRNSAYKFVSDEIIKGHQVYIICPLVEASETTEAQNVDEYTKKLSERFPEYRIRALHGKMKSDEKNSIMKAFSDNEIDILVSTTVVEVGVNVPNATVMMIENANRFGLAQLHQLRGRVGRGDAQSYCILMNSGDDKESDRLKTMLKSNNGFVIASEDLKQRGPGDFFGIRQSGDFSFKVADVIQDAKLLSDASDDVKRMLTEDPDLNKYKDVLSAMNNYISSQYYVL